MRANPMYHLCALWRGVFCVESGAAFPYDSLAIFAAWSFVLYVVGFGCFHRWKGLFADEV
jgi:ABC-type polysaccharide/polyol phosphate export permease